MKASSEFYRLRLLDIAMDIADERLNIEITMGSNTKTIHLQAYRELWDENHEHADYKFLSFNF